MSFATNVQNLATRISSEVKALRTLINGNAVDNSALTTTAKTNLVAAINEVNAKPSTAPPDASETVKGIVELATAAETTTGISPSLAVHPAGLKVELDKKVNSSSLGYFATGTDAGNLTGTVPSASLPPLAITKVNIVATQAAMLALVAEEGDIAKRTDTGRTYFLAAAPATTLANWIEVTASGDVTSVAGRVGAVALTKTDVGLANVDNTSDATKPVSTEQAAADDLRLLKTANLSDVANVVTARTNLEVYSKAEIGNPETDFVATFNAGLV